MVAVVVDPLSVKCNEAGFNEPEVPQVAGKGVVTPALVVKVRLAVASEGLSLDWASERAMPDKRQRTSTAILPVHGRTRGSIPAHRTAFEAWGCIRAGADAVAWNGSVPGPRSSGPVGRYPSRRRERRGRSTEAREHVHSAMERRESDIVGAVQGVHCVGDERHHHNVRTKWINSKVLTQHDGVRCAIGRFFQVVVVSLR